MINECHDKSQDPADNHDTISASEIQIARRIRVLSIVPLLIAVSLVMLLPGFRRELQSGLQLLLDGDLEQLKRWTAGLGAGALAITGILMVAQAIVAPIPAVLVTAANSYLLGPFWGGIFSVITANLAAAICYGIGRGYGAGVVSRLVPDHMMNRTNRWLRHHGVVTVMAARLVPIIPFDPISYLAGIMRMRFWPFFWATMIGQLPAGMAYSYLAWSVSEPDTGTIGLLCSVVAVAAVFGYWLLARNRLKSSTGG